MQTEANALPLAGVRVLDLSRALSGPFCTMLLGDLGADVIKVEPLAGDMMRAWGPLDRGESVYFLSANRNKRSLAIDLHSVPGLAVVRRLAERVDAVVENFRPGVARDLGLDYETLAAANGRLVYCSISAFGSTGPLSGNPGFDQIAQGLSGLMSLTGHPETGPVRVGVAVGDLVSGIYAALGVAAALRRQAETGRGGLVQTSLLAALMSMLSVQGQRYLSLGEVAGPAGNDHPSISPYGVFAAQDGYFNLAAATQGMWERLCQLLGAPELAADPRFRDQAGRFAHREALKAGLNAHFRRRPKAEWIALMGQAGIPCGAIDTMSEVFANPQVAALGMVEETAHEALGALRLVGSPLRFGAGAPVTRRPPPALGAQSCEILADLGLDASEVSELIASGVVIGPGA